MKMTFQADDYSLDKIDMEQIGFFENEGEFTFTYLQRGRKGNLLKVWQKKVVNKWEAIMHYVDLDDKILEAWNVKHFQNNLVRV